MIVPRTPALLALASMALCVGCSGGRGAGPGGVDAPRGVDAPPSTDGGVPDAGTAVPRAFVLHETFDAMATGAAPTGPWAITASPAGAVVVDEVPFPADKSATVRKPDATGASSLAASFAPQHGRVVVEAKVMADELAGFKALPYVYDAAGDAVASVYVLDGNLTARVGATPTTIAPVRAHVWYRVRLVVDTAAGVFDLYVDGVRKLRAAALRTPAAEVARVAFFLDGTNTGTLHVDDVWVLTEAGWIGAPPAPAFDVRTYGAVGDGATDDTAAIQRAVDAAAGTGGSVVLQGGTFLAHTITLRSGQTFFIDATATLLGSPRAADYPAQAPATGNTQLGNCQRALLYADAVTDLAIDGGGTIDGQGDAFTGVEATRPMLIWAVLSSNVAVRNLYLKKGAVWSLVAMESDHVRISDISLQSNGITHDGIDVVDGSDVAIEHVAVTAGDDAMCLKSGVRRGLDGLTVRDSVFVGDAGGSNGIKIGTGTYGAVKHVTFSDSWVKDVQYAALAVESRQGADVAGVAFERVQLFGAGAAFFVYLAQQDTTHPVGDVPKLGSMDGVSFTDVSGDTASWPHAPHQASLVTGHVFGGTTYPITNLVFRRVAVRFDGGLATVPGAPPEAQPNQYPEANMFGDLPAAAYWLRHVAGVTFDACTTSLAAADARPRLGTVDVSGLVGAP